VFVESPNQKGAIAETAVALAALQAGVGVYAPLSQHARCDLLFDIAGRLQRVQVKTARQVGEVLVINLVGCRHTPAGYVRTKYARGEVDLIAAYCHANGQAYLIPFDEIADQSGIQLRLSPARNGQQASVHLAAEYELPGAVAQLEVAPEWHSGGRGFESRQLHSPPGADVMVGANEFRNRFGRYMERAAAGETLHVTRRGKPYVTLGPGGRVPASARLFEA
jgi:hypothetical protein